MNKTTIFGSVEISNHYILCFVARRSIVELLSNGFCKMTSLHCQGLVCHETDLVINRPSCDRGIKGRGIA